MISSRPWTCLQEVQYDCVFGFKYSGRPNTPALTMIDSIPEAEKAQRLQVALDRQREIQRINYSKHLGRDNGSDGRGYESGPRTGHRSQQPEQAGELYDSASHCARARLRTCSVKITDTLSQQSGGRGRLIR